MKSLTEEQVWSWIDQGIAEDMLEKLRKDPTIPAEDLRTVERLLTVDRHLSTLPLTEPSAGFNEAVLARIPGLAYPALPSAAPLLSGLAKRLLLWALPLILLASYVLSSLSGGGDPDSVSGWSYRLLDPLLQRIGAYLPGLPDLSSSWLWTLCLVFPGILLFYFMDRAIQRLWKVLRSN